MKKVRIAPRQEVNGPLHILRMFPDAETLYVWMCDQTTESYQIVDLEKDEILEVEWMGCEFVGSGVDSQPMHLVRAVRALSAGEEHEVTIQPFYGWIPPKEIEFYDYVNDNVTVVKVNEETSKIDMKSVFGEE